MPCSLGWTWCVEVKTIHNPATPPRTSGSQLLPPGLVGRRNPGPPPPPPPRLGPPGPRRLKISSILADRRPSPEPPAPPPCAHGLRGPSPAGPSVGVGVSWPSSPAGGSPSPPLPPQGLFLPAIATPIRPVLPVKIRIKIGRAHV